MVTMIRSKGLFVVLVMVAMAMLIASMVGCTVTADPVTGQKTYALSEPAAAAIDKTAAATEAIAPAVSAGVGLFSPAAGTAIGALASFLLTLYGTYKKWKEPLMAAADWQSKAITGLKASAEGWEIVKSKAPGTWQQVKPLFKASAEAGGINPDKA